MEKESVNKGLLFFLLTIFALEAVFFYNGNLKFEDFFVEKQIELQNLQTSLDSLPLVAKAVSVYNVDINEKIYGRNDEESLPIASLAKTMTVAVALSGQDKEKFVYLTSSAINQFGDFGLFANEKWKIKDLAQLTLISSANDGAFMLGGMSGTTTLNRMNEKARKIGMGQALFLNFTGLDIILNGTEALPLELRDAMAGAHASASDANLMAMYLLRAHPDIVEATTKPEITLVSGSGFTHNFKNTNIFLDKTPNLLFSKTGFTEIAGGNLTVIFANKNGIKFAATVLGSTTEERFTDMEKIVNVLYGTDYTGRDLNIPKP